MKPAAADRREVRAPRLAGLLQKQKEKEKEKEKDDAAADTEIEKLCAEKEKDDAAGCS